jgi:hypothetical protein
MNESDHAELRQLIHDIRSPFSVISMGIEALRALRTDELQFNSICDTVEQEGVEKLRAKLDSLPDVIAKMLEHRSS